MTSLENDITGKRALWKTTSMEDNLNEDDLNGKGPKLKKTSKEDDLNGSRPQ